ncbi:MAG: o-succinylbenzoate--CoA ligase [Chloroflexi bacterium]|nr:o-succinylbenzoate--CoA ligase [Chloroflexota bacterium]
MQLPDWLAHRAATLPHRPALMASATTLSYSALDAAVDAVVAGLQRQGVRPADRVALLLGNGLDFAYLVHAAARFGFAIVPLNTRLTAPELAYQVEDAGARFLVHDGPNHAPADALAAAARELKLLSARTLASGAVPEPEGAGLVRDPSPPEARWPRPPIPTGGFRRLGLSSLHTIVYTSGTTGPPKGVPLSLGNHWWAAIGSALNLGVSPEDRMLVCLPLYHVGGLSALFRGVIYGSPVVLHEEFDASAVNRAIDDEGVTMVSVVALMLRRMLDERGERPYPASLRSVLVGGGPVPETLLRQALACGLPVLQTYGLTESASQAVTLSPEDALRKLGSAGKPLLPVQLRVMIDNREAEPGEVGEICLRGPSITSGYLGEPNLPDGWLPTGDLGWLDEEGYLYVSDRRDDLIISGGENVYPAEVEAVLLAHPSVEEAGVAGLPDPEWGQVPVAFVKLRSGASALAPELLTFCETRLARYKVPRQIRFVESLPRTSSGKLLRRLLRGEQ